MDSFTVETLFEKATFDKKAISELIKKSKGDVALNVAPVTKLSKAAKKQIGKRLVMSFDISYAKGKKHITSLGKGSIAVSIPYKSGKNEKADGLFAVYVDKKGKTHKVKGSHYDVEKGDMVFTTSKLGVFGVGYKVQKVK